MGVIKSCLGNIYERYRDTCPRTGTTIGLPEVGAARLLKALQLAQGIGQSRFGEQITDVSAATFKHPENIAGLDGLPCW